MKIYHAKFKPRGAAGILLIECLVYLSVFALLTGIGFATFYLFWDNSRALVYATDDIGSALRAGESWRADVRKATGKISIGNTPDGELLTIPQGKDEVYYSYHHGAIWRKVASAKFSELLFEHVNSSQMSEDVRGSATAWRWELDLVVRRPETHLPLLFTFEAAAKS